MNSSFTPRTLLSLILPGLVFLSVLGAIFFDDLLGAFGVASGEKLMTAPGATLILGGALFSSFFVGTFFDAIRNLFDNALDWCSGDESNWSEFFFKGDKEKVSQLDDYYYSYYQCDLNLVLASLSSLLIGLVNKPAFRSCWVILIFVFVIVVLVLDAFSLRNEFKRLAKESLKELQNGGCKIEQSNTRIGISTICEGVGVFAIKAINKGSAIFPGDDGEMTWISKDSLEKMNLSPAHKKLLHDFSVFKSDECGCPSNFDKLTVSWYLNEPKEGAEPNTECRPNDGYKFYAARDIAEGEELTAVYSRYSLDPWIEG